MPPKIRITKESITDAAVEIVRTDGEEALNARSIAAALHCSTQPVFSNFASMNELRFAVLDRAEVILRDFIRQETESGKYLPYKAGGMAYIRFAREEKNLFRLLYMRDRSTEEPRQESDLTDRMTGLVQGATGFDPQKALLFHLEMWAFVHGVATMFATGYLDLDHELVSSMLTDIYQGLTKRFGGE